MDMLQILGVLKSALTPCAGPQPSLASSLLLPHMQYPLRTDYYPLDSYAPSVFTTHRRTNNIFGKCYHHWNTFLDPFD